MPKIAMILFMNCINVIIPNPHTVNNLPDEQRQLIVEYARSTCQTEVEFLIKLTRPVRDCVRGDKDCL